ncbi:MAG: hypothetical protein R3A52_18550 [Polyangiales bacterium]
MTIALGGLAMRLRTVLALGTLAATLAISPPALALSYLRASCNVDGNGARCVFTSTGSDATVPGQVSPSAQRTTGRLRLTTADVSPT